MYFLRKMYKYNLEIFYQLTLSPKLSNLKEVPDPLKLKIDFIDRQMEDQIYRLDSRQVYFLIEDNIQIIFQILKNLVKIGHDTYP